jgi:hypothetical protein
MVAAGLQVPLARQLALHGALELDYVVQALRGHDATGSDLYALEGLRLTLTLGLALPL